MPTTETLRDISKRNWTNTYESGANFDAINTGSLLRIADAVEILSNSYTGLLDRVRYQAEDINSLRKWNAKLERRVRGLRGALTRKRKESK